MRFFKRAENGSAKRLRKAQSALRKSAKAPNASPGALHATAIRHGEKQASRNQPPAGWKQAALQMALFIGSTLLVLLTLFEVRAQRSAAYLPSLFLTDARVAIAWDSSGHPSAKPEAEANQILSTLIDDDTPINALPRFKVYNIGAGAAKEISFMWNAEENARQLMELWKADDAPQPSFEASALTMNAPPAELHMMDPAQARLSFLLGSTGECATLPLPLTYFELLKELYIRHGAEAHPTLSLRASYSDLQGKAYSDTFQIYCKHVWQSERSDGSGFCLVTLAATKEDTPMSAFDPRYFTTDDLIAITSVFAVVISVISMDFTVIFSMLQVKHNQNSVKPISSIKVNDYEDLIAVKIQNVGTGPLTIQRLVFKNACRESSTLIDMMPPIDQPWSTFTECVDGWTIPVGGHIILLELHPQTNAVKASIREVLSTITVSLDYTDIYQNPFYDERALSFFGRHSK